MGPSVPSSDGCDRGERTAVQRPSLGCASGHAARWTSQLRKSSLTSSQLTRFQLVRWLGRRFRRAVPRLRSGRAGTNPYVPANFTHIRSFVAGRPVFRLRPAHGGSPGRARRRTLRLRLVQDVLQRRSVHEGACHRRPGRRTRAEALHAPHGRAAH